MMGRKFLSYIFIVLIFILLFFGIYNFLYNRFDIDQKTMFKNVVLFQNNEDIYGAILLDSFSYSLNSNYYLSEIDILNPFVIDQTLSLLDSLNGYSYSNELILSDIITDSLNLKLGQNVGLDTIKFILDWNIKLRQFSEHSTYPIFYKRVSDYWFNYCGNVASLEYSKVGIFDSNYKSKFILDILSSQNYNYYPTKSNLEKVIYNISKGNFTYVLLRILYRKPIVLIFAGVLLILMATLIIFKFKKNKT